MKVTENKTQAKTEGLPKGWRWVKLGEVGEINPRRPKNFNRTHNAPTTFVPMVAVDEKTGTIAGPEVVPYSKVAKGYTHFEENDVLFAKITPSMQNGKHAIAKGLIDGVGFGTTEFHVLRPKNNEILSEWIYYFIRQPHFLKEATTYFTGAVGQQRVPDSFLAEYIIPLPPLPEQHRIAAKVQDLMHEVERARSACEKQLEAVKALPAAYLRQVFESEETKKWERKGLGDVCDSVEKRNPLLSPDTSFRYVDISSIDNISKRIVEARTILGKDAPSRARQSIKANDVLIATTRPNLNAVALLPSKLDGEICSTGFCVLRPTELVDPSFLFAFVQTHYFIETISGQVRGMLYPAVTDNQVRSVSFPLPSLPEQKRIAAELKEKMAYVKKLRTSIDKQLEAITALPQSILRKAFKGEV
ncbi:MAG: restriction endonuclease subunit S [Halobacteriota archaeon]